MAALEIWYQQGAANDYGDGHPAIIIDSVDAFVDGYWRPALMRSSRR